MSSIPPGKNTFHTTSQYDEKISAKIFDENSVTTRVWVEYLGNFNWYQRGEIAQRMLEILLERPEIIQKCLSICHQRWQELKGLESQTAMQLLYIVENAKMCEPQVEWLGRLKAFSSFITPMWFKYRENINQKRLQQKHNAGGCKPADRMSWIKLPQAVSVEETETKKHSGHLSARTNLL